MFGFNCLNFIKLIVIHSPPKQNNNYATCTFIIIEDKHNLFRQTFSQYLNKDFQPISDKKHIMKNIIQVGILN